MPVAEYNALATVDVPVVGVTETVVITLAGVSTPGAGTRVILRGTVQVTNGTGATAQTLRVRRGTDATGTLIGEANVVQISTAAGSTEDHEIEVEERPGELVSASYVLTVQQTAAGANGSALQSALQATVG